MTELADKARFVGHVKSIVTFRFLTDREIEDLFSISEVIEAGEGEVIVQEGEISPYLFGIIDGSVGVSVAEAEGKQVYVTTLGAGDVFGEAGIFMKVKRTATVAAASDAVILRIHRKALVGFLNAHAEAGNKILLTIIFSLLRKLRAANQELAYERKSDLAQDDIDDMVKNLLESKGE